VDSIVKASLSVDLGGLVLRTPVMAAAGCLRDPKDLHGLVDVRKLGGIVTPSISMFPLSGSLTPRVTESASGVLTATGWQNSGVEAFLEHELPAFARTGVPVFVSIAGQSVEEYVRVARSLHGAPGVSALEVNLACSDTERGGGMFAHRADWAAEVVGAVSRLSRFPVFAKLSPDVPDIVDVAGSCVQAGANGLTLINGVPGMGISPRTMKPQLGSLTGILSGPAVKPIAIRAVYLVSRAMPDIPILGVGGIAEAKDAVEMMLAGASAVQVGTSMLVNPSSPVDITKGVLAYLRAVGLSDPAKIRGTLRLPKPPPDDVQEGGSV
jgi:dihydroorotate dehydrogenase (NAD+) catalytic subunit